MIEMTGEESWYPRPKKGKKGTALQPLRARAPGGTRTRTPKNLILSQARLPIPPQALKEGHHIRALSAPPENTQYHSSHSINCTC